MKSSSIFFLKCFPPVMKNLTVAGSRPAFNDELPYLSMASPDYNTAGGMLNGHGVGIAMAAIFAGIALVVAFAASDGAIFGQNFSSASDNSPVIDSETDDAAVLSRDAFDEGSDASAPPESGADSATLSEEERRLRVIKDFPLSLSDRIFVNVDHDRDDEEQPADDAPEDEQDNTEQQGDDQTDDSSGEGSSGEDSDSGSGNGSGSDNSGSGSNSTGSQGNSTNTQGPSENPDGGNSTSVETSVSLG